MKRHLVVGLLLSAGLALSAHAADVGVSVTVGEPGFYGRINIGNFPAPAVIYSEPMIVRPVGNAPPPVYLRVPPGHSKNWKRYCGRYQACGQPVYFVRDDWYRNEYAPHYYEHRDEYRDDHDNRGRDRGDKGDRGRGHERGHGHGHGHD